MKVIYYSKLLLIISLYIMTSCSSNSDNKQNSHVITEQDAYNDGYKDGLGKGKVDGYNDGYDEGYSKGYDEGSEHGVVTPGEQHGTINITKRFRCDCDFGKRNGQVCSKCNGKTYYEQTTVETY